MTKMIIITGNYNHNFLTLYFPSIYFLATFLTPAHGPPDTTLSTPQSDQSSQTQFYLRGSTIDNKKESSTSITTSLTISSTAPANPSSTNTATSFTTFPSFLPTSFSTFSSYLTLPSLFNRRKLENLEYLENEETFGTLESSQILANLENLKSK